MQDFHKLGQVAALDLDMAFDAPGFIRGMSGSVFGASGKASGARADARPISERCNGGLAFQ